MKMKKWTIDIWNEKDVFLGTRRVNKEQLLKLKGAGDLDVLSSKS